MVLISILLLVAILVPILYSYYTSDERVNPSNQNYPLYNLLDLSLNNETRGNITAQVLRFNDTSDNWEVNSDLIQLLQGDLKNAVESIENLEEISLYSINSSYLPGELCFILVTEISEAKNIITTLISDTLSNNKTFWYLDNASFHVFDIAEIAIWNSLSHNVITYLSIFTSYTNYTSNETSYVCSKLDGSTTSPWLTNVSSWNGANQFGKRVSNDLTYIEEKILEVELISLSSCAVGDGFVCENCIRCRFSITYNEDINRNEQFKNFFLLCTMIESIWYVEGIVHTLCECPIDSSWQFSTFIFAFVILLVFKSSRRKVKHSKNDKYVVRRKIIY